MKHMSTSGKRKMFEVLLETAFIQAATMTLQPGQSSSDDVADEHPQSEQWVFVISGHGKATVKRHSIRLKTGSLLLISRHEPHKITNTGTGSLRTLNFYAPPAYTSKGNVKRAAKTG